uniref:BTB domain-containing protein n=1 Tax=Leersia perrieri TaxID=77586 RepID=A0A0D9X7Q2_9ORYZ
MSTHTTEIVKGSHQFTVAGYSLQKTKGSGHCIVSASFEVGGYRWAVEFYPAGNTKEDEGHVSVFLGLQSTVVDKVTAKFIFHFKGATASSSPLEYRSAWKNYTSINKAWGYNKLMKIETLESQYLINDSLTMLCEIEVVKASKTGAARSRFITVPPPAICNHLEHLLESKEGSDVTVQVEQSKYDVHRAVLAARSPVFRAQFFGPMAVANQLVRILDIKPAVFEAVLHFVYTGTLPPVEEEGFVLNESASQRTNLRHAAAGCSKQDLRVMVCEWLKAADRFDLERMRLLCENALCETIDVANVASTLRLADQHNCSQLKSFCMEYIASPGMLAAVMATEGFKELKLACPSLLIEILEKLGS